MHGNDVGNKVYDSLSQTLKFIVPKSRAQALR